MASPAEAAAQVRRFDIPAQPARTGIPLFAHQAGIQILASGPITEGVRVNRVKGSMEVAAALRLLLTGTDLVPVKVGNAFVLKRREAATSRQLAVAQHESAPQGQADGAAQQTSDSAADAQAGEDIVVTGIRASLQESINVKRTAGSIVDVITAQDIGKLPDQNVAESMSRVTGVQISRREGDGSNFTVRGISQNRLEINGRNYIGPGNGGNAALESVSPEILSSIVVIKSPTADMPEGALGATVNLKTKRPLDLKDLVVAGRIQGAYADQADHVGYRGSAMVSKKFGDRFGILASVAYSDTKTQGYSFDAGGWTQTGAIDGNGDGVDDPGLFRPNRFMARIFDRSEQRLTVNGTAQWRPTDTLEVILDATFNHLKRQRNSVNYQVLFNNNDVDAIVNDSGTVVAGTFTGVTVRPLIYDEPTDLKSTLLGGSVKWENGRARVSFDMSYAHGKGSDGGPGASFTYVVVPRDGNVANASYDFRPGNAVPDLSIDANFNPNDPANYRLLSVFDYDAVTENKGYDARLDWRYRTDWGFLESVEAGMRYERVELLAADPQNLPIAASLLAAGDANGDGILTVDELPGLSYGKDYGAFFPGASGAFPRDLLGGTLDKRVARDGFGLAVPDPYDTSITVGPTSIKDVKQDTLGAYVKGNFEGTIGGLRYSGNAGIRYVDTARASKGYLSPTATTVVKSDFSYWLPSANLSLNFSEDLTLRLAAAKVVARPSLNQVSASFVPNTVSMTGSRGNPNLRPFEATQYDATLEWYFAPSSSLTGALFYKKVDSFTVTTVTREYVPGFSDRFGLFDISQPQNGEDGSIKGFEVAYQHAFRFLPGPFDNLGIQANYTYVDSTTPLTDAITGEQLPLPGLSRDSYTLIGYYEDGTFSLRVAYTYRSKYLNSVGGAASGGNTYIDGRGQLDASAQINLTPNLRLTFEGINLTKAIDRQYLGEPDRLTFSAQEDRRIFFGIAASF
ncbi:TonB-dependent receptor [Sphingomonas sp. BT-65]|uniref:TonB-dependent receptor n=1 Tax=Sphingomonas sp. BT-65 TaxID=2989821 RepID=UPI002235AA98|nr:TonB-dependent receptor [Sphingomonas sp. BT-65]MCW4460241.1 TonB-dependent receptor [Sphingomonas sp. BT-65]